MTKRSTRFGRFAWAFHRDTDTRYPKTFPIIVQLASIRDAASESGIAVLYGGPGRAMLGMHHAWISGLGRYIGSSGWWGGGWILGVGAPSKKKKEYTYYFPRWCKTT